MKIVVAILLVNIAAAFAAPAPDLKPLAAKQAAPAPAKQDTLIDIKRKAEGGDAKAQVLFADEFARSQKFATAEHWYRAAAVQGEPSAIFALASLYGANRGDGTNMVKANITNVIALHKLAAGLGFTKSHAALGAAYKDGINVRKDPVRAYGHLKLSDPSPVRDQQINQLVTEMSQEQIDAGEKFAAEFKPVDFEHAFADVVFESIQITGIFGAGPSRVAMLNGKPVNAGQDVSIVVGGLRAPVKFTEISSDSVFVSFGSTERKIRPRRL